MTDDAAFRAWTPTVYETLHATLSSLSEGIETPLTQLAERLEVCFPVFQNILQNPVPAEADRKKLLSRNALFLGLSDPSDIDARRP